jgi:predicted GNAT family N-acyltransferase
MITNEWIPGFDDYSDALNIRETVFIKEQHCPEDIERDEWDGVSLHLVVYDNKKPVGCGRIVIKGDYYKLGRIAVLKEERGRHIGDLIVRLLLFKSFDMGIGTVRLDAQITAENFYKRFGFVTTGGEFMEAGIRHVPMRVTADEVLYPSSCHSGA